jgi:hypothetical protein
MAETRQEGAQVTREPDVAGPTEAAQQQGERFAQIGRESVRQATDASKAAASSAARSASTVADCAQDITSAWASYTEDVMRNSSAAGRELLRARTFNEMLDVQAKLFRDNLQAFLDQTVKIAEAGTRMAARPLEALREATAEQARR